MTTRAQQNIDHAIIKTRTAIAPVARFQVVKEGTNDGECQPAAAGEAGIGVALYIGGNTTVAPGAIGDYVDVVLSGSGGVVPVTVGTGGATREALAKVVADGVADAAPNLSGGATQVYAVGQFIESGVAGDRVGMQLCVSVPILE